jgi:hypothetical protein
MAETRRCSVAELNPRGVHELCPNDGLVAWTAEDAGGRSYTIPLCVRHLFAALKVQQAQRERLSG